jgi:hypothetical protein
VKTAANAARRVRATTSSRGGVNVADPLTAAAPSRVATDIVALANCPKCLTPSAMTSPTPWFSRRVASA